MIRFTTYVEDSPVLCESSSTKNVHLEHIEEIMLDGGSESARSSLLFLRSLKDMLSGGKTKRKFLLTTKYDGSPSLFAGRDPEDGKFFVATKSIFNKTPKLNKTPQDIKANHRGGLATKLFIALKELPALGIKGIVQGDMMFTKDDLEEKEIDGEKLLIFQPNTIAYGVPADSLLAKEIRSAALGVVWHTRYSGGPTIADTKASFDIGVEKFRKTKRVWFRNAAFRDISGVASFLASEEKTLDVLLNTLDVLIRRNKKALDKIGSLSALTADFKIYNNSKIREGGEIGAAGKYVAGFFKWFSERHKKQIAVAKLARTRDARAKVLLDGLEFIRANANSLTQVVEVMIAIIRIKNVLLQKLVQVEGFTKLFVRDGTGYRITAPEGFVAINHTGNAVKLVDRLEFSRVNFVAAKNWVRG